MCGILACSLNQNSNFSVDNFQKNLLSTNFRGPDYSNSSELSFHENKLFIGHNRLSILDVSKTGNQPMASKSGRFIISFNGEIYNHNELRRSYLSDHTFNGTSDTETLIQLIESIGLDRALEVIYGMFAFVVFDTKTSKISIARDIPGEKPLYIMTTNESISFSSDITNFHGLPGFKKDINHDAVKFLLSYTYIPSPISIFKGIFKLPASKAITIDLKKYRYNRFETYQDFISSAGVNEYEYFSILDLHRHQSKIQNFETNLDKLEDTLSSAVKRQLISDVPLGAFLSGGIDSSLIVALAMKYKANIKTFNIGFEFQEFDESDYALKVSQTLGTDHTMHTCSKNDAINFIKNIPKAYSEPFADSSQIPTMLVSKIASNEVKAVLTGDSGDELFGGYNRYSYTNYYWKYLKFLPPQIKRLMANALLILPAKLVEKVIFKILSISVSGNLEDRISQFSNKLKVSSSEETFYRSFLGGWSMGEAFLSPDLVNNDSIPLENDFDDLNEFKFIEKMMIFDFKTYMTDDILCKVDRGSMFSSLETRVPFLDKDVIKLSASTPIHHKINGLNNKVILKKLLSKYLPENLINRPKMGFGIPVQEWIKTDLNKWAEELLSKELNDIHNIFDHEKVSAAWEQHKRGDMNNIMKLWPIIQFNQWYNHNF